MGWFAAFVLLNPNDYPSRDECDKKPRPRADECGPMDGADLPRSDGGGGRNCLLGDSELLGVAGIPSGYEDIGQGICEICGQDGVDGGDRQRDQLRVGQGIGLYLDQSVCGLLRAQVELFARFANEV